MLFQALSSDTALPDSTMGCSLLSICSETSLIEVITKQTSPVVTASKVATVAELTYKMAIYHTPCVVILDSLETKALVNAALTGDSPSNTAVPVGLVTEQEIANCQIIQYDSQSMLAQTHMRAVPLLEAKTTLWAAYQTISQQKLPYGVVVDEQGTLLGLVSQTSLLQQLLNPTVVQAIIETLKQQLDHEKQAHQQTQIALALAQTQLQAQRERQVEQDAQLKKDMRKRQRVESALRETLQNLQQTQAQIIHQERMAGLGQLIAGVAHEINNPVNFIHGNLKPAKQYAKDLLTLIHHYQAADPDLACAIQAEVDEIDVDFVAEDFPRLLDSMKAGTERIREIVKSLRNFSRLDEAEFKRVDIHEGIENTLMILQHRLNSGPGQFNIQVVKSYSPLPEIECYASQLNQVFLYLISNAIDALCLNYQYSMPDFSSPEVGVIKIETEVLSQTWVAVHISDNGPGIPESDHSKVFDPFFTTKPVGQGTGLGLSISHQIVVDKHGGKLFFQSALGHGSRFSLKLPCSQSQKNS